MQQLRIQFVFTFQTMKSLEQRALGETGNESRTSQNFRGKSLISHFSSFSIIITQIPVVYFNPFQSLVTMISYHELSKGDNLFHNGENGRFIYHYFIYPFYSIKQCNLPLSQEQKLPHIY